MAAVQSVTDQSLIRIRSRAVVRLAMLSVGKPFSRCLINEFPKSGGSWLAKMVAGGLELDFPQNVMPSTFPAIFHGHYMKEFPRVPKLILWRDPRDIMVSWYYHCLFGNERNNLARVEKNRARLGFENVEDIKGNMAPFIDWCFGPDGEPGITWGDFFDRWYGVENNTIHTSYERLRTAPVEEIGRLLHWLGAERTNTELEGLVDKYSFGRQSHRKAGEEEASSFLRKGIVGDWKNVFDETAERRLNSHLGDRIEKIQEILT